MGQKSRYESHVEPPQRVHRTPNDEAVRSTSYKSVVQGLHFEQMFNRRPSITLVVARTRRMLQPVSATTPIRKPTLHVEKSRQKNLAIHSVQCSGDQYRSAAKPPHDRQCAHQCVENNRHGKNRDNSHGCICFLWWEIFTIRNVVITLRPNKTLRHDYDFDPSKQNNPCAKYHTYKESASHLA